MYDVILTIYADVLFGWLELVIGCWQVEWVAARDNHFTIGSSTWRATQAAISQKLKLMLLSCYTRISVLVYKSLLCSAHQARLKF
jgi:hypothetical protein